MKKQTQAICSLLVLLSMLLFSCRLLSPALDEGLTMEESVAQTVAALEAEGVQPAVTPEPPEPVIDEVAAEPEEIGACQLVFISALDGVWDIIAVDFNTRQLRQLTAHDRLMGAAETILISVSPDGDQLAFNADMSGSQAIYVINVDGSGLQPVGLNPDWDDVWPDWSPDGGYFLFGSNRDGDDQIFMMDTTGGEQERVTFEPGEFLYPAVSPDGSRIAMVSKGDGALYVLDFMTMRFSNLTGQDYRVGPPDWSPDGERLVFSADLGGSWHIFVLELATRTVTQLTEGVHDNSFPAWSPDGGWIAFSSDREGQEQIYLIPTVGGEVSRLTNNERQDLAKAWLPGCMAELDGLIAEWDTGEALVAGDPTPVVPRPPDDPLDPPDDPLDPPDDPLDPPEVDPDDPFDPPDDPLDPPDDPLDPPDDPLDPPDDPLDPPDDPLDPPDDPLDPPDDPLDPPDDPLDPPDDPLDPPDDPLDPPEVDPDDPLDEETQPPEVTGIPIIDIMLEWLRHIIQRIGLIPFEEGEEGRTVWEDLLDFLGVVPDDDPVMVGIGQGVTATVTATLTPTVTATPTLTPTVTPTITPTPEEDYFAYFRTSSGEGDIIEWTNFEGLEGTYTGLIYQYDMPFGSVIALTGAVFTLPRSPVAGACSGVEDCGMWRSEPFSYSLKTVIEADDCQIFRTMAVGNVYLVITSYTPDVRATGDWVVGSAVVTIRGECPDQDDFEVSSPLEPDALSQSVDIRLEWLPELVPIVPAD